MVGPDFKCLLLPHQHADLFVFLVLQELGLTDASLFPFRAISIISVQLSLAADRHKTAVVVYRYY